MHVHLYMYVWGKIFPNNTYLLMIDSYLMPTLAVFQLYRGVNHLMRPYFNENLTNHFIILVLLCISKNRT